MKEEIIELVNEKIKSFDILIATAFISKQENKNVLNIELDSKETIDLDKVTAISRIINQELDKSSLIKDKDIALVDIYSKESGTNG